MRISWDFWKVPTSHPHAQPRRGVQVLEQCHLSGVKVTGLAVDGLAAVWCTREK